MARADAISGKAGRRGWVASIEEEKRGGYEWRFGFFRVEKVGYGENAKSEVKGHEELGLERNSRRRRPEERLGNGCSRGGFTKSGPGVDGGSRKRIKYLVILRLISHRYIYISRQHG